MGENFIKRERERRENRKGVGLFFFQKNVMTQAKKNKNCLLSF